MSTEAEPAEKDCCVRVAVRIRPQNSREKIDMCRVCAAVTPEEPQIVLGQDKAFTFDYVFDMQSNQSDIYDQCVKRLVDGALCGYNATVLAYGQTGSGKTYTMGTGFDRNINDEQQGIIPRAMENIFSGIQEMQSPCAIDGTQDIQPSQEINFSVAVQFMEIYNEDIIDLLDPYNKGSIFKIHEDSNGQISVSGITIRPIQGAQDALKCLQQGALARTTASTQMNDQSSRSHALFTILIRRQRIINNGVGLSGDDIETLTSKFHFVDLAGSERLKRTGATGERAREGISINCGLLALGNCISALGDKAKKATHIPYRDSKLTRLLQDSLGGNSQTLMIACISPSDRDFMETLNTLKYANRARNIKNKVQINQDQSSRTICQLRTEIAALQLELLEYKQGMRCLDTEGNSSFTDTYHENALLTAENKRLQQRLKAMQETINVLSERNAQLKLEIETNGLTTLIDSDQPLYAMVAGYLNEIEKLQAKLIESEEMYQQLKKSNATGTSPRSNNKYKLGQDDPEQLINLAKKDIEKNRETLMSRSLPGFQENSEDYKKNEIDPDTLCESDDSESESDDKTREIQQDLNDINSDIEIKTKLIEQLELSQQRMQLMRQHYEEKLNILNSKILNTQKERDEVLANMGHNNGNQSNDKVKKVKDEYERKITDMQRELKKLQQAEREHARQHRELKAQEFKLSNLRTELAELKSIKTRLIRKMCEQTNRHKEEQNRRTREIAQLRKEQRRQENTVKSLQAKMNAKEQILKRKTEEVYALRRSQRGSVIQKISGRTMSKRDANSYNMRSARQRWESLNRAILHASRNKQVVVQLEKELERLINERESLSHDLANIQSRQTISTGIDLANDEDTIKSNLSYIQDNITQVQQAIMEFEEGKDSTKNDAQALQGLIGHVQSIDEAKFLLERLVDNTIMFSCNSALTENRLLEHEALIKEIQQESTIQQQLLQHFLSQNNSAQISDLFESLNMYGTNANINNLNGSQKSLISNGTYDIPSDRNIPDTIQNDVLSRSSSPTPTFDLFLNKSVKVRRRTAHPQDLLFGDKELNEDIMARSFTQQSSLPDCDIPLMRIPSAPGSLRQSFNSSQGKKVSDLTSNGPQRSPKVERSTKMSHKADINTSSAKIPSQQQYLRTSSREDSSSNINDVFLRLATGIQDRVHEGSIQKINAKVRSGVPLCCTHVVSGHNNAVLSMAVDENILYTGAADRTVKVWDLTRPTALHSLSTHLGPVIAVQNDISTRLLFTASGPFVRVWDLRTSNSKAIKTLSSSGLLINSSTTAGNTSGESPITALCVGPSGNLYVSSSDKVRIWEIKSLSCIGKLSGGHQAAVMCTVSWTGLDGKTDFVATGSKDHYVKVFEAPTFGGTISPLLNLEPPHYDGIQSLIVSVNAVGTNAILFSGSRDLGIKQWDLKAGELKQSLNNAHKGWVTGMAITENILLSSCRGGVIRLWNTETCESIAEMKTDSMINDILTRNRRVFVACGSGDVKVYRLSLP